MDFLNSRYFRINKVLLFFLGLWPYQTSYTKYLFLSFNISGIIMTLLPQVLYFLKHLNDLDKVLEVMPMTCAAFISLMKITCLARNLKQFEVLLRLIQEDWNGLSKKQEIQIITRHVKIGQKFTLIYLYSVLVIPTCYAMAPVLTLLLDNISPLNETRPRKLLYPAEYLVNQEKYFYVLLLIQYVPFIINVLIVLTTDTTYFLLLEHIYGMHAILCRRLEILKGFYKLELFNNNQSLGSDEIDRRVRHCIQLDKRIRVYIELMESAFAASLLVDITMGSVLYTCTCIMIVVQVGLLFDIIRFVGVAVMQCCRFFLISWSGQKVIDHSSDIPIAVYNAEWYRMPIDKQKILMLLIARSQRPSQLIMAGIYIINLENFNSVMKTSLSYCTVMISLRA